MDDLQSDRSEIASALRSIEGEAAQANAELATIKDEIRGMHDKLANMEAYQARALSLLGTISLILAALLALGLWASWKL